ncbi:hypothetical protein PAP_06835 [Palaeococcus pacificus DY20341]|uniref:CobQ/CobB/MinD/ParA nucleotide binding domain-containing protein n=1 Tax=Palaeococcus pacificus DY20341 TaxID=1343739 RepID=A0A075LUU2_9EURY|nr:MinD/ParA family protein [Palaeococcus pacificus]AIF69762.1 hypothetical protein PAP_06835 [Palaeococcus pacificus DY20341]
MVGVVITGRGGAGKTTLTANLGVYFARQKYKTIVIDGDLYLPKLGLHFGLDNPRYNIHSILMDDSLDPQVAVYEDRESNLFILPGSTKFYDVLRVPHEKLKNSIGNVMKKFALSIVDSPTGIPFDTMPLFSLSQYQIVVVEIERSPIYSFETLVKNEILKLKALGDIYGLRVGVILNKVRESADNMERILKFLDETVKVDVLGVVPFDGNVPDAINVGRPILAYNLNSPASRAFAKCGEVLEEWIFGRNVGTKIIDEVIGELEEEEKRWR